MCYDLQVPFHNFKLKYLCNDCKISADFVKYVFKVFKMYLFVPITKVTLQYVDVPCLIRK